MLGIGKYYLSKTEAQNILFNSTDNVSMQKKIIYLVKSVSYDTFAH